MNSRSKEEAISKLVSHLNDTFDAFRKFEKKANDDLKELVLPVFGSHWRERITIFLEDHVENRNQVSELLDYDDEEFTLTVTQVLLSPKWKAAFISWVESFVPKQKELELEEEDVD